MSGIERWKFGASKLAQECGLGWTFTVLRNRFAAGTLSLLRSCAATLCITSYMCPPDVLACQYVTQVFFKESRGVIMLERDAVLAQDPFFQHVK